MKKLSIMILLSSPIFGSALGALSQQTAPVPGGFLQAGAGATSNNTVSWPGMDWLPDYDAPVDFHEQSFSGNVSLALAAASSSTNVVNSASGTVGMGYATMAAQNQFLSSSFFSLGMANGGWNEAFLVSNPAYTGQTGYLQFTVNVIGRLEATGITGAAWIRTTAYKNNSQLLTNGFSSPGNSDVISSGNQYGNWQIQTGSFGDSQAKNVSDVVTFAAPFTFGTPFTLGVYVFSGAGQRSAGANEICTSHATLKQFNWGGISNIYVGTSPVAGSTVISGTGINWAQPVPPKSCPGDLNNDGQVDDSDFVMFVAAYNTLDCADPTMAAGCPADFNGDGLVDDGDFVIFVGAYNALLCP